MMIIQRSGNEEAEYQDSRIVSAIGQQFNSEQVTFPPEAFLFFFSYKTKWVGLVNEVPFQP